MSIILRLVQIFLCADSLLASSLVVDFVSNSTTCQSCIGPNGQPYIVRNNNALAVRIIAANRTAVWYPTLVGSASAERQYRPHRGFCLLRYDNPRFPGE